MFGTPTLKQCWQCGLEPILFFDDFQARRKNGKPLTEDDRIFLRTNKPLIIAEIKSISFGERIGGEKLYGALLEDRQRTSRHVGVHREGK